VYNPLFVLFSIRMRINQYLASAGLGSRRSVEDLVTRGSVVVNGKTIRDLGFQVDPDNDIVLVKGQLVSQPRKIYMMLNKPTGYICTRSDERDRKTVYDILPKPCNALFTVGRIDKDTEGLILLTNDGEFAEHLMHPRYKVPKVYHVVTASSATPAELEKLKRGVMIKVDDTGPMKKGIIDAVTPLHEKAYEVVLTQGLKRQIRQMFYVIGHPVKKLRRIRIGNVSLGKLPLGHFRELSSLEVKTLLQIGEKKSPTTKK